MTGTIAVHDVADRTAETIHENDGRHRQLGDEPAGDRVPRRYAAHVHGTQTVARVRPRLHLSEVEVLAEQVAAVGLVVDYEERRRSLPADLDAVPTAVGHLVAEYDLDAAVVGVGELQHEADFPRLYDHHGEEVGAAAVVDVPQGDVHRVHRLSRAKLELERRVVAAVPRRILGVRSVFAGQAHCRRRRWNDEKRDGDDDDSGEQHVHRRRASRRDGDGRRRRRWTSPTA